MGILKKKSKWLYSNGIYFFKLTFYEKLLFFTFCFLNKYPQNMSYTQRKINVAPEQTFGGQGMAGFAIFWL